MKGAMKIDSAKIGLTLLITLAAAFWLYPLPGSALAIIAIIAYIASSGLMLLFTKFFRRADSK
jgi:hypothetical protein